MIPGQIYQGHRLKLLSCLAVTTRRSAPTNRVESGEDYTPTGRRVYPLSASFTLGLGQLREDDRRLPAEMTGCGRRRELSSYRDRFIEGGRVKGAVTARQSLTGLTETLRKREQIAWYELRKPFGD